MQPMPSGVTLQASRRTGRKILATCGSAGFNVALCIPFEQLAIANRFAAQSPRGKFAREYALSTQTGP